MKTPRHIAIAGAARRAVIQMEQSVRLVNNNDFNLALRDLRAAIELPDKTAKLFTLVIENECGITSSIHSNRKNATAALYCYVCDNWGEMGGEKLPKGKQTAIDMYFGRDENDDRAEISMCEIED